MKDLLQLHLIVFIWGFTAILGKLIDTPSVELVFYRALLTTAAMGAYIFWIEKKSFRIPKIGIWQLLANGVIVGAHWITFFMSADISTASICLAGLSTASLWTSILEPILLRKKFYWYELVLGFFVIIGLWLIAANESLHLGGLVLGIVSALLAAIFSVLNGRFSQKYEASIISFYEMVGVSFCCVIFFVIYKLTNAESLVPAIPTVADWGWLLILALLCTVYPFIKTVELLKRLSAFQINLTVNLEPVYGILMAAVILHEYDEMTKYFYVGTFVILLAVLIYPTFKKRFRKTSISSVKNG